MSEGKVKDTLVKFKNAILRLAEDGDSYRQKLSEVIENLHKKNEEMEKRMNSMQQNIQKLIEDRHQHETSITRIEVIKNDLLNQKHAIEAIEKNLVSKNEVLDIKNKTEKYINEQLGLASNKLKHEILSHIREDMLPKYLESIKMLQFTSQNIQNPVITEEQPTPSEFSRINTDAYVQRPNISRINTDEIRKKIVEAISSKESQQKTDVSPITIEKKQEGKNNISELQKLIQQIKFQDYTLPCFFDGNEIFGIYDAKKCKELHIFSKCPFLPSENLARTSSEIGKNQDGAEKKLDICKYCVKELYKKYKPIKMSEFIDDFLSGKIHS